MLLFVASQHVDQDHVTLVQTSRRVDRDQQRVDQDNQRLDRNNHLLDIDSQRVGVDSRRDSLDSHPQFMTKKRHFVASDTSRLDSVPIPDVIYAERPFSA